MSKDRAKPRPSPRRLQESSRSPAWGPGQCWHRSLLGGDRQELQQHSQATNTATSTATNHSAALHCVSAVSTFSRSLAAMVLSACSDIRWWAKTGTYCSADSSSSRFTSCRSRPSSCKTQAALPDFAPEKEPGAGGSKAGSAGARHFLLPLPRLKLSAPPKPPRLEQLWPPVFHEHNQTAVFRGHDHFGSTDRPRLRPFVAAPSGTLMAQSPGSRRQGSRGCITKGLRGMVPSRAVWGG